MKLNNNKGTKQIFGGEIKLYFNTNKKEKKYNENLSKL